MRNPSFYLGICGAVTLTVWCVAISIMHLQSREVQSIDSEIPRDRVEISKKIELDVGRTPKRHTKCFCAILTYKYDKLQDGKYGCKLWKSIQKTKHFDNHPFHKTYDFEQRILNEEPSCDVYKCPDPESLDLDTCQFLTMAMEFPPSITDKRAGQEYVPKWCNVKHDSRELAEWEVERTFLRVPFNQSFYKKTAYLHRLPNYCYSAPDKSDTPLGWRGRLYTYMFGCNALYNDKQVLLGNGFCAPSPSNPEFQPKFDVSAFLTHKTNLPHIWQHFPLEVAGGMCMVHDFFKMTNLTYLLIDFHGNPGLQFWEKSIGFKPNTIDWNPLPSCYKEAFMLTITPQRPWHPIEYQAFADAIDNNRPKPKPVLKKIIVWMSRRTATSRNVTNEGEILDTINRFIDTYNMDLEIFDFIGERDAKDGDKLYDIFRRASVVIGPHGAAWGYALSLAKPGTCFIEICYGKTQNFKSWWYGGWAQGQQGRYPYYFAARYRNETAEVNDIWYALVDFFGVKTIDNYKCIPLYDLEKEF